MHVEVERPARVRVRALDPRGAELLIDAEALEARVIQHEIDHLDGVLILDRISREARREAMRALREAREAPPRPLAGRIRRARWSRHAAGGGRRRRLSRRRSPSRRRRPTRSATRRGPSVSGERLAPEFWLCALSSSVPPSSRPPCSSVSRASATLPRS